MYIRITYIHTTYIHTYIHTYRGVYVKDLTQHIVRNSADCEAVMMNGKKDLV